MKFRVQETMMNCQALNFLLWAMSEKPVDILNVKMQIRHLYIAVDFFIINNAGRKGDGVGLDDS